MIWVLVSLLYLAVVLGISVHLMRQYLWDQEPEPPTCACNEWRVLTPELETPGSKDEWWSMPALVQIDLTQDSEQAIDAMLQRWQVR